jgi:hypothetical protein
MIWQLALDLVQSLALLGLSILAYKQHETATSLRSQYRHPAIPPPDQPSAVCHCGGTWAKWEDMTVTYSSGARWPAQQRKCDECGYAEVRRTV